MSKTTVMPIFGTRPEAIKMLPLVRELSRREGFCVKVCLTGQHRDLVRGLPERFGVQPHIDLALMQDSQTQPAFLSSLLAALPPVLAAEKPSVVLVHGDTASAFGAALTSFLQGIPVAHVEAGLRTHDPFSPFPEEYYRTSIARMASLHFAPTEGAKKNLLCEGIADNCIFVTGNTAIDALAYTVRRTNLPPLLGRVMGRRLILVTAHRRENHGDRMRNMLTAIRTVARERPDIFVAVSAHPNPHVREITCRLFENEPNCLVIPPPNVFDFHTVLAHSYLVLTDSGGLQEEAPALHVPVLVMREETERPEGIEAGCLRLVGTEFDRVASEFRRLLDDRVLYRQMQTAKNPFGDGKACIRIADAIEKTYLAR